MQHRALEGMSTLKQCPPRIRQEFGKPTEGLNETTTSIFVILLILLGPGLVSHCSLDLFVGEALLLAPTHALKASVIYDGLLCFDCLQMLLSVAIYGPPAFFP